MLFKKNVVIPEYYEFFNSVKIISGYKALETIPFELSRLGAKRPIIITDKGVAQAGLIKHVVDSFSGTDTVIGAVFDETPQDSSNVVVNQIASIYRANNCDSIIAVGGGSAIDTAKGVNIVITENSDDLLKFMGNYRLNKPMKPFVVIPTTAGTGSEVTMVAVIANPEKNVKMAFTSDLLLPKFTVLDPRMTASMPPKITAATGMDALTHAVEAFIGTQKNPVSDAFAAAAMELIRNNIVEAVKDGSNKDVRLAMANASMMAGLAFSNSMVGIVHATAHATGGICHVPHGIANSILLPYGLEFYIGKSPKTKEYIESLLLHVAGPEVYVQTPSAERAAKAVMAIRNITGELNKLCGLPVRLSEAGVTEDKLESIAKTALNDGALSFSPVEVSFEEAFGVLKAAY
ncbi:MAG: alcohol dehydrogenase [Deltaproteobacteria bacterium HGW-Deltaproteobacteria-2]|jgi:alcohol dehydrogenase|nr:MAG: alcohol dehydrogenase [Deltaproteobacteria bacterium HGW-Deltaproteobacteria-2]